MITRAFFLFLALVSSTSSQAATYTTDWYYLPALYSIVPYGQGTISATAISDSGQITGSYNIISGTSGLFSYANGVATAFQYPTASYFPGSVGSNSSGSVVGTYQSSYYTGVTHGFQYSNGVYTTIDNPGVNKQTTSPFGTSLTGINNSGQIVGNYGNNYVNGVYSVSTHAFTYSNGVFTTIDDPNASETTAYSINNNGQIVGTLHNGYQYSGFIFDNGVFTHLNYPGAGGYGTFVTGNNDLGQVVGYYYDSSYVTHSFIYYDGAYSILPLANYVNNSDTSFPETLNNYVYDINNNGQILGAMQVPSGYSNETYTVVLTPVPEPFTYAMMLAGLGLVGVVVRRSRQAEA
jgi:hypothetical protein